MLTAKCIGCGCTDDHACVENGQPCHWLRVNRVEGIGVCSSCPDALNQFASTSQNKQLDRMTTGTVQNGRIFHHALVMHYAGPEQSSKVKRLCRFYLSITASHYKPVNAESVIAQNGREQGRGVRSF